MAKLEINFQIKHDQFNEYISFWFSIDVCLRLGAPKKNKHDRDKMHASKWPRMFKRNAFDAPQLVNSSRNIDAHFVQRDFDFEK